MSVGVLGTPRLRLLFINNGVGVAYAEILRNERSLLVVTPSTDDGTQAYHLQVTAHNMGTAVAFDAWVGAGEAVVVPVSPDVDTTWDVLLSTALGFSGSWYCFAQEELPLVDLVRGGQQLMAHSVPVAIASDQNLRANLQRATLFQTGTSPANTAQTVTLPAAGAGLYHYVTHLRIVRIATAALAGGATLAFGATNMLGLGFVVGNAMAAGGTQIDVDIEFVHPFRSSVPNTASTFTAPACGAAVLSRIEVTYYTAPA